MGMFEPSPERARKPQDDDPRISSLAAPHKHKSPAPMMHFHDLLSEALLQLPCEPIVRSADCDTGEGTL